MQAREARWIEAAEASLAPLRDLEVIVLGYGNQGRAQALNLRDSKACARVRVWARPSGPSATRAREDGFGVVDDAELAAGDLFLCLLPDEVQAEFLRDRLTPILRAANRSGRICFAHGFAMRFTPAGEILRQAPWIEAILVAPTAPGDDVRGAFLAGGGTPAFVAVWHDATGEARARGIAIAHAIGATRAGVLETTVGDEAVVDLFGEQAVICGGLAALVRAGFETLTRAGYAPEMAYLECVHQVQLTADLIRRWGVGGMRARISGTALYGDLTRGPRVIGPEVQARMADILNEIETGEFSHEWLTEQRRQNPRFAAWRQQLASDPLESVGQSVRQRIGRAASGETT